MARLPRDLVAQEVLCCMSSIVSTLANRPDDGPRLRTAAGDDLADLCWQAIELASPIDDWEEAAIQAGWTMRPATISEAGVKSDPCVVRGATAADPENVLGFKYAEDWQDACEADNLEPYRREVFEHWAVTDWLADKLDAHGEKVDKNFGGLCIWACTTTGQAIYADGAIERICDEANAA